MRRILLWSLLTMLCLIVSACEFSLRPQQTNNYVVIEPGNPVEIVDLPEGKGKKVLVLAADTKSNTTGTVDVTGWEALPPAHFRIVVKKLQQYEDVVQQHPELFDRFGALRTDIKVTYTIASK